jgi:hypothetical protein
MPRFACGNKTEKYDEEKETSLTRFEEENEGQEIDNSKISKDIISETNKFNKYLIIPFWPKILN